jgi:pilus assembly protein Flp/PilA
MTPLAEKLQRFLVSEDGPTAVEYAVMLTLIILVCFTAIISVGSSTQATFTKMGNSMSS